MATRKAQPLDAGRLWEYALQALARRALSAGELRLKLAQRAERASDAAEVIARLKESGLLDDHRFAQAFAAARRDNEGFGKLRVRSDLARRRVAPGLARQAVEEAFREADEGQMIEAFLARKYRARPLEKYLAEPRNLAAAYRRLRTAGFSAGASIRALKRHAAEADLLDQIAEGEDWPGAGP